MSDSLGWTDEERGCVETALAAADAGNAGHWPTVAAYLAAEVRRLRAIETTGAQPECGAVDRSGQRRCVFTPGHHEVENWTSHGDRSGWTWNDQPAED